MLGNGRPFDRGSYTAAVGRPCVRVQLATALPEADCLALGTLRDEPDGLFADVAVQLLARIRDALTADPAGQVLVQVVVTISESEAGLAGLAGLLKTARAEDPHLVCSSSSRRRTRRLQRLPRHFGMTRGTRAPSTSATTVPNAGSRRSRR